MKELFKQLEIFYNEVQKPFSGIGLIITDNTDKLPIHSIYDSKPNFDDNNLIKQLHELSSYQNLYHDGFHVISSSLKIEYVSQYFYPTPPKDLHIMADKSKGVRYFVAKIGSLIPDILYTIIISDNYGICIFKNGKEIEVKYND